MKFNELPTTARNGRLLQKENALISKPSLTIADHGCLTAWIGCDFDDGGCSFGGYVLGKAGGGNLDGKGYAAEFIVRTLKTVGVELWEDLHGKSIRVLHEGLGGGIVAIGHFLKDEWFCPRMEFEESGVRE